jgi:hypothetical protein
MRRGTRKMAEYMSDNEMKVAALGKLMGAPEVYTVWRHYKGGIYVVVAVSLMEDSLEPLVTYRSNKHGTFWTRTMGNFLEHIETSPGFLIPRFFQVLDCCI